MWTRLAPGAIYLTLQADNRFISVVKAIYSLACEKRTCLCTTWFRGVFNRPGGGILGVVVRKGFYFYVGDLLIRFGRGNHCFKLVCG